MFKKVAGTKDILPGEISRWQKIEEESRRTFEVYNYQEIRTPLIEEASLFNRSLGEFSEVVQKQMFLMRNKEDVYALRPEATASIVRAYIENSLDKTSGFVKLYYIGPMFRLERPQKGRLRQFHHIGCEAIGSSSPDIDVEMIALADRLLQSYSITGYNIQANSLGCVNDKKRLAEILKERLSAKLPKLCEECHIRFDNNILRILDCKNEKCREVLGSLDIGEAHLCQDCKAHFDGVKNGLGALKIRYEVNHNLVRGLDYYTRTVFEIKHKDLGAQDALGAGGRYDNLVRELGGPDTGAIGFAFGIERLLLVAPTADKETASKKLAYLITLGDAAREYGAKILNNDLRAGLIASDTDYSARSLKGAMRAANDLGARFVIIIGDEEIKKNVVTLKDMESGEQAEVKKEDLINRLK
ncbi:MAG: histidine--tRNA ligase [Deltaproteobacteria bacterium]